MMMRQEYMNAPIGEQQAAHCRYYGEIAEAAKISHGVVLLDRVKQALRSGDQHLNTIPLGLWDNLAISNQYRTRPHLKDRGDAWSLGTGVCIEKEAARRAVEAAGGNYALESV